MKSLFKSHWIKFLSLLLLFQANVLAHASSLAFQNLSDGDVKELVNEFSANFTHTSVSGASPLGSLLGVELGLIGGRTRSPQMDSLAKSADPSVDANPIYHGGILGVVSVPFGLTLEASLLPKFSTSSFDVRNLGLAIKWSLTSSVIELPVSLAIKLHHMGTKLHFSQTVSSVQSTVDVEDKVNGALLLVSKDFVVVEPYLGFGVLKAKGDFDVSGTTTFFSSGVTSKSAEQSSAQFLLGVEAHLLVLKLGLEVARQFGTTSATGKVSFYF
ncbi:MAG: hypothetical protein K1X29_03605 [Bdellovibrionales bacterium]|nr:hypothetical protein [Bdellovibrionales bacterium]